jgi:hypothetical protein
MKSRGYKLPEVIRLFDGKNNRMRFVGWLNILTGAITKKRPAAVGTRRERRKAQHDRHR